MRERVVAVRVLIASYGVCVSEVALHCTVARVNPVLLRSLLLGLGEAAFLIGIGYSSHEQVIASIHLRGTDAVVATCFSDKLFRHRTDIYSCRAGEIYS